MRRDFQRLQQENKERSEAHKRQQAQLAAQRRDPEEHKRQLLRDRQKRIEEQKEQRHRLEEVTPVKLQKLPRGYVPHTTTVGEKPQSMNATVYLF